jgi:hypothetical protein
MSLQHVWPNFLHFPGHTLGELFANPGVKAGRFWSVGAFVETDYTRRRFGTIIAVGEKSDDKVWVLWSCE